MSPPPRAGAAFAFDGAPGSGFDLLFGGETASGFLNDTWEYENATWVNVTPESCAAICPPDLAYASMSYDPAARAIVLLGGLTGCPTNACPEGYNSNVYLFVNGSWQLGKGTAPYPADGASMAWYATGQCLLVFGGAGAAGPSGSTYCYNATTGAWTQLAGSPSPGARWGASMTNSSLGFDVLFGGSALIGSLNDTWIFDNGSWRSVRLGPTGSPPGRVYASLAESPAATVPGTPASGDVVLFGGEDDLADLNDTWTFRASDPTGAGGNAYGNWTPDLSVPTPPPSDGSSATLDFNASRIVWTQGAEPGHPGGVSSTWAYFHLAAALNESVPELNVRSTVNFSVLAGGGSPPYAYAYSGLPTGCSSVDAPTLTCVPTAHGRFSPKVVVTDQKGRTTSSNLSLIVDPYGSRIYLHSEFQGVFYTNFSTNDTFGVDTAIGSEDPAFVSGMVGTESVSFHHASGTIWNASVDMGSVLPGARLQVEANYTNWSLFASMPLAMAESPAWMRSIFSFPGAILDDSVNTTPGEWNDTYAESITMGWSIGTLLNFALPTPGFSGAYSMIPGITATFAFDSAGNVTLGGKLSSDPSISIGPVDISADIPGVDFSATVELESDFKVVASDLAHPAREIYVVQWDSVTAKLDVDADFSTEVPLFPAESPEGGIGLSLLLKIAPSVSVTIVLGPANAPGSFLSGLDFMVQDLLVDLGIAFTVALQAGISDVFEIGGGGTVGLQTLFQTATPHLAGIWLNASVFAFVQLLCFKITWTLWSGTIYQYGGDPPSVPAAATRPSVTWSWALAPRYYNTTAYDTLVWNASAPSGPAIEDIFPTTSVAIASGGPGTLVAYTSDNVEAPERSAIGLDGVALGTGGGLTPSTLPSVPGSVSFSPELLGLANGNVRLVFSAAPVTLLSGPSPTSIPGYALETALRTNGTAQWSAPTEVQDWGYPISYAVSSCGSDGTLAVLDAPGFGPNLTTPERLLVYDAATSALEENVSVKGMAEVTGYDCSDGLASLTDVSGNASFLNVRTGAPQGIAYPAESGWNLSGISWVQGASGTSVLLYRSGAAAEAVVYEPGSGLTLAATPVPPNAIGLDAAAAGGGYYLFVSVPGGVDPYFLSSTARSTDPEVPVPGLTHFGIALGAGRIVLFGLGATGNTTEPTVTLYLAVLAVPLPPSNSSSPVRSPSLGSWLAADAPEIALTASLAGLILAAVWLYRGGRRPPVGRVDAPEGSPAGVPGSPVVSAPAGPAEPPASRGPST
ncbi:MAG TPA: kelch repeat-containing protein [Thermoplasmata archaeon]|nr:kelch repeat-containing protein [Thermoplasmata archaeon]